jgi:glycine/D-amino acid oxidase-like deaminating enzyme
LHVIDVSVTLRTMADSGLDVAVIGAGVIGLAIARELTGRGVRVAVFERTGIGAGASGVQPGGVRQQWGTPVACRLARESAAFYAEADERLDAPVPLGFRACGYLFVAHTD